MSDRSYETAMYDGSIANRSLQHVFNTLVVPGVLIGHRVIHKDDDLNLFPDEVASLSFYTVERRRASGAARHVARELMNSIGFVNLQIPRSTSGAPIWPTGVVGSIAHDDQIAVAAVGLRRDIDAVGIDIESTDPLSPQMLKLIATSLERRAVADNPIGANLLFAIKEAVYKATYPLDHEFLDFHDIEIDLPGRLAITRTGHILKLHWCFSSHVLVVATVHNTSIGHLSLDRNCGRSCVVS
jgi:4'-phosphopantetheinyl transferase EntD